ncbi:unnamed protein product, partial [Urochloa humidicola]
DPISIIVPSDAHPISDGSGPLHQEVEVASISGGEWMWLARRGEEGAGPAALLHGVEEQRQILAPPPEIRRRCLHPEIRSR